MHQLCAPSVPRRRSLAVLAALALAAAVVVALATPSTSRAGWLAPTSLSGGMAPASANWYDAIVTPTGVAIASWTLADGGHAFSRSDVAGTWSAPARMAEPAAGLTVKGRPLLALTPDGVLALWTECPPGDTACAVMTSEYVTASSAWSVPVEVANGADASGISLSAAPDGSAVASWASFSQSPRVVKIATGTKSGGNWSWGISRTYNTGGMSRSTASVIDSNGNVTVGWHDDGDDGILYVRRVSGTWSANPASISPNHTGWGDGFSVTVRFAVDSNDVVTAVWNELVNNSQNPTAGQPAFMIRASRLNPVNQTWSAPVDLSSVTQEGFDRLDVVVDSGNRVTAAWVGNGTLSRSGEGVYVATFDGATWSAGTCVSGVDNVAVDALHLLATDQGALVVWGTAGQTQANLLRSGGWKYPTTIARGGYPLVLGGSATTAGWPTAARVFAGGVDGIAEVRYAMTSDLQTAPTAVQLAPEFETLDVSWERPSDLGQWGVTSYTATATPGGASCTTAGVRCSLTGLDNGTTYTVVVTATSPSGTTTSAPASAAPLARDRYVGPLTTAFPGYGGTWDGAFGMPTIAYDVVSDQSLVIAYGNDGSGPGYDLRVLGRNGAPARPTTRVTVAGPDSFGGIAPAVAAIPGTGGWIAFYYEGPAGSTSGSTCGASGGSESAGVVKAVLVGVDGTLGTPSPVIDGICGAGPLSAQWDTAHEHFLVAGAIETATGGRKLRGRFVGVDGAASGAVLQLGSSSIDVRADVAFSSTSHRYFAITSSGGQSVGTLIDDSGAPVSGLDAIPFPDNAGLPASVAYDGIADQFVVVWGDADVIAQRVDAATGGAVGGTILVAEREWTDTPHAVANPFTGEILVYWEEYQSPDDIEGIGVRPLAPGAGPEWDGPFLLSNSLENAMTPGATFDSAQCAFRVAFVGQVQWNDPFAAYTRGVQPDRCDRHQLDVATEGTGSGSVTSDVGGIDCGATCTAQVARTTETAPLVTLTATPTSGSAFQGWTGACTGTGTCTVSMGQARAVTAQFEPASSGGGSDANSAAASGGGSATSASAPVASAPATGGLRLRGGGPRQIGDVLITVVDLPSAGTVTQVGRAGKRAACRTKRSSKHKRRVALRCKLNRRVVRAAARAVRTQPQVPIRIVTTFTPAAGGAPVVETRTVLVREFVPRPSRVTG